MSVLLGRFEEMDTCGGGGYVSAVTCTSNICGNKTPRGDIVTLTLQELFEKYRLLGCVAAWFL
jgi:hypothetical protein